jgi:hypothetical protein
MCLTKPYDIEWPVVIWMMRDGFLTADPARLSEQFAISECNIHSSRCLYSLRMIYLVGSNYARAHRNPMRQAGSLVVIGADLLAVIFAVLPDVFADALFALIQMTISHLWVLVKSLERLFFQALDARLSSHTGPCAALCW